MQYANRGILAPSHLMQILVLLSAGFYVGAPQLLWWAWARRKAGALFFGGIVGTDLAMVSVLIANRHNGWLCYYPLCLFAVLIGGGIGHLISMPNQLPDPTSPSVTPPAGAGGAPSVAADH
jgi:hypothetical protein